MTVGTSREEKEYNVIRHQDRQAVTSKTLWRGSVGAQCLPQGLLPHQHSECSGKQLCKLPKPWHETPSQLSQIHPKSSTGSTRQHHIYSFVLALKISKSVKGE